MKKYEIKYHSVNIIDSWVYVYDDEGCEERNCPFYDNKVELGKNAKLRIYIS